MRINMDHTDGRVGCDGLEYREGDGMITTGCYQNHSSAVHGSIKIRYIRRLQLQIVAICKTHVTQVGDSAQRVGVHAQAEIEPSHQTRGIADLPGAVPCSGAIGDSKIGRYADQTDVDLIESARQRCTHERGDFGVAWLFHGLIINAINRTLDFVAHWILDVDFSSRFP